MNAANVSVIIPAYRAAATIGRALASIACQTVKPREVIVVDDGSDDGTAEAAEAMREDMNSIELIILSQHNKGAGAARNKALAEASSDYIAFLDADDEWMPEKIERSMAVLVETGSVLVAHDFIRRDEGGREEIIQCARNFNQSTNAYSGLYRTGYIGSITVVVRRDVVLAVGGFDETLAAAQDFDLWLRILNDPTLKFIVLPEVLSLYYVSGSGITSATARRLRCTTRVAVRHAAAFSDLLYRLLAIHYEALSAYIGRGRYADALWICLAATVNVPAAVLQATVSPSLLAALSWGWVIGAFVLYTDQFRSYLGPIMKMFGLL